MRLFDEHQRTSRSKKRPTESIYAFYDRIALPYFAQERALLERWFASLPPKMKKHVHGAIRSGGNEKWHSAFWEMYLYTLFRGLCYEVEYEPRLPHTSRSPDFLVAGAGASAYVEARGVFGDTAADKQRAAVEEAIEEVYDPNFAVWVGWAREHHTLPSLSRLRRDLTKWLAGIGPVSFEALWPVKSLQQLPTLRWEDQGWEIEFQPWLKPAQDRGVRGGFPTIAGASMGMRVSRDRERIRKALAKKAGRYGTLDRPLVVALLSNHSFVDEESIIDALFGSTAVQMSFSGEGLIVDRRPFRQLDGAWRGPHGKQRTRLSALIVGRGLFPSSILSSIPQLWVHPEPEHEFSLPLPLPAKILDTATGQLIDRDCKACARFNEIFGVPADWPGGDPWRTDG